MDKKSIRYPKVEIERERGEDGDGGKDSEVANLNRLRTRPPFSDFYKLAYICCADIFDD